MKKKKKDKSKPPKKIYIVKDTKYLKVSNLYFTEKEKGRKYVEYIPKKKKKGGMGKRKGNSYEIQISRILSEWYVKNFSIDYDLVKQDVNKKYDYFWRTAGSGAKSTITKRGETSFVGDVVFLPEPDRLKIWIDAKDRKDVTFNTMLTKKFVIYEWYKNEIQKRDKLRIKKPVVIIFKFYGRKENYIFYRTNTFTPFPFFEWSSYLDWGDFRIMRLNAFLKHVKKESILK